MECEFHLMIKTNGCFKVFRAAVQDKEISLLILAVYVGYNYENLYANNS